jgi:hypothetical protein
VLGTSKALNITISINGGSAQLLKGVTFKANGAAQLLTDVDLTSNVISVTWTGSITDGKATIQGKIDPISVSGNPTITVTKIQTLGGQEITSEVTAIVTTSSSVVPLPTPSPSPNPSPTPESLDVTVSINAPDTVNIVGKRRRSGVINFTVQGSNFTTKEICELNSQPVGLLRIQPRRIKLEGISDERNVVGAYSIRKLKKHIRANNLPKAVDITLEVVCPNNAKGSKVVKFKLP